jgi:hypothetical protein
VNKQLTQRVQLRDETRATQQRVSTMRRTRPAGRPVQMNLHARFEINAVSGPQFSGNSITFQPNLALDSDIATGGTFEVKNAGCIEGQPYFRSVDVGLIAQQDKFVIPGYENLLGLNYLLGNTIAPWSWLGVPQNTAGSQLLIGPNKSALFSLNLNLSKMENLGIDTPNVNADIAVSELAAFPGNVGSNQQIFDISAPALARAGRLRVIVNPKKEADLGEITISPPILSIVLLAGLPITPHRVVPPPGIRWQI